jgi:hypothetical protein
MTLRRFNKDFLNKICNEQNIVLLRDYDNNNLGGHAVIEFKCIKCKENTSKKFEYIVKNNPMCRTCSFSEKSNKAKNTILARYGVTNISQLDEIKNKKKATTMKNYGVEHNSQSKEVKNKKIETCIKNNGVEYPQQSKEIQNKSKQTCLLNYGVEHPCQSLEIKNKSIQTSIIKFGTEYASQCEIFKNKVKDTCLKKYNVEYPQQSKVIQNKSKQTSLLNYGVEHPSQSKKFKDKIQTTNLQKYGFTSYSKTAEFKEKCKQTSLKKYGVEHPLQNSEVADNASKKCYKLKTFCFPSGKQIKCQGYEPFALQELTNDKFEENDVITGCKNVPKIWYDENNKKRRHYVDIFIPSLNKCIEVKSTWTFQKKKDNIFLKQSAAKELGYNYEIWVYNSKGNKVETHV